MSKLSQEPETYKTSYKDRDITLFDMLNNIKNKKKEVKKTEEGSLWNICTTGLSD